MYRTRDSLITELIHAHGGPALYAAVAFRRLEHIELLVGFGADVNEASRPAQRILLLTLAIIIGLETNSDSSWIVAPLLGAGADLNSVPVNMWLDELLQPKDLASQDGKPWCTPQVHTRLQSTLTITHVYLLRRARRSKAPSERELQIARGNGMSQLLKIDGSIIGQEIACAHVINRIFAHVALEKTEPLLLAFAGPAGHGKTELAEKLGKSISAESISINYA